MTKPESTPKPGPPITDVEALSLVLELRSRSQFYAASCLERLLARAIKAEVRAEAAEAKIEEMKDELDNTLYDSPRGE